jgi:D-glycero-D-manno-heptose 1,7-bisphosphate phosphatase
MRRRAVFLDRDGVINRDSADYITHLEQFEFYPGSLDALRRLTAAGFPLIVVTNQSAVGREWLPAAELERIHAHLRASVAGAGGRILDIRVCPHRPSDGCACRKPLPGLLHAAAAAHEIDLRSAVMIGDSSRDIECALRAGVGTTLLVRTGNGERAGRELAEKGRGPDVTLDDLSSAADWLIANRSPFAIGRPE